jgi:DNA-binding NarL/FixJ family response regulator
MLSQGQIIPAQPLFEESLVVLRELGDKRSVTMCLAGLADVALSREDPATARTLAEEAVTLSSEVGDRWFAAFSLDGLANAMLVAGQAEQSARLFGAAMAMRAAIGAALPAARQAVHQRCLPLLRTQLSEAALAAAWKQGQNLTLEQILAIGRAPLPSSALFAAEPAPPAAPAASELTAREIEVLRLVAQGLTDAQVAGQLIISPRTVHSHLASIYSKLGVNTRTAAARYAVEHKLI